MQNPEVFSYEEIEIELQNVLNFSLFKNSPTLSKFLNYIVKETLHDKSENIKEYNIAVNVLNRPSNFNCNDDAIVRVHAGRLRRTLNLYYVTEGKSNRFYIDIPKGSYIPHFKQREQFESKTNNSYKSLYPAHANLTVAIFPFRCLSGKEEEKVLSLLLGEEASVELSRFKHISVIGYYSAVMLAKINRNILEAGKIVNADYIITGSIQFIEDRVRIRIFFLIASTGEVMMTKSLNREINTGMFEVQDEIIQSFTGAIGDIMAVYFKKWQLLLH